MIKETLSIEDEFSFNNFSTCNHCFGQKKKEKKVHDKARIFDTLKALDDLKVHEKVVSTRKFEEPETVFERKNSSDSLTYNLMLLECRQGARPSIMICDSMDSRKKFNISAASTCAKKGESLIKSHRPLISMQNIKKPYNSNKSCARDFNDFKISNKIRNSLSMIKCRKLIESEINCIQISNNAPNSDLPVMEYALNKDSKLIQKTSSMFRWSLGQIYPISIFVENEEFVCVSRCYSMKENLLHLNKFRKRNNNVITTNSSVTEMKRLLYRRKLAEMDNESVDVSEPFEKFIGNFKEMRNQNRFIFTKDLGEGAFGQVIECQDLKNKRVTVAIKITKYVMKNENIRTREIDTLLKLHQKDPSEFNHCANLLHWFKMENRLCLVFKSYGDNLYIFMKKRNFEPLPINILSQIAFQLFHACTFLHDTCHIIHTDLKPENILFTSQKYISKEERGKKVNILPSKLDIKIIDFGNAVRKKEKDYTNIIGTKQYRALEVILGQPWNEKVDCWSLGCIIYEIYMGRVLFKTKEENIHLAMIEKMIGPINPILTKTCKMSHLFLKRGIFNKSLIEDIELMEDRPQIQFHFKRNSFQSKMFTDIIIECLRIDSTERPNCRNILQSRIFQYLPNNIKRKYKIMYQN